MSTVNWAVEEITYFLNLHANENYSLFYSGSEENVMLTQSERVLSRGTFFLSILISYDA